MFLLIQTTGALPSELTLSPSHPHAVPFHIGSKASGNLFFLQDSHFPWLKKSWSFAINILLSELESKG